VRITKRQLRRIIQEERQRELPIEFYTDEQLMSEGLLDWVGGLFSGLVDFFTGGAEKAREEVSSGLSSELDSGVAKIAEEEDLDDIKSIDDLDTSKDDHKQYFYKALAGPLESVLNKSADLISAAGGSVKDWTPKSDSEEDQKAWKEGDGKAAQDLWAAVGYVGGAAEHMMDIVTDGGKLSPSVDETLASGNPGEAVKFLMSSTEIIGSMLKDASKLGVDTAEAAASAAKSVSGAAKTVGEAIAASGKEQKKEEVTLRRWVGSQVIHERKQRGRMKITKRQLRRIIKEAIDPRAASVDTSMFMSPAELGLGPDTDYDDNGPTFTMVADMLGRSGPDDILFLDDDGAVNAGLDGLGQVFIPKGGSKNFDSGMESGTATQGTVNGEPAVMTNVMGYTTVFI
jgi:hypothetical protein